MSCGGMTTKLIGIFVQLLFLNEVRNSVGKNKEYDGLQRCDIWPILIFVIFRQFTKEIRHANHCIIAHLIS
jgi:hypothetical protein